MSLNSIAHQIVNAIVRKPEPQPCTDEIIPVGDWVVIATEWGLLEGILIWKQPEWGRAGVLVEASRNGKNFQCIVSVWEADIRRLSCWLDDPTCAPHQTDNYLW